MNTLKDLTEKYSLLFYHEEGSLEPFALFGFECSEGWYDLISTACYCITSEYRHNVIRCNYIEECLADTTKYLNTVRTWRKTQTDEEILKELQDEYVKYTALAEEAKLKLPKFTQIKEKFGTLRMYYDGGDDVTRAVTTFAEIMSSRTCEVCGDKGETIRTGWHRTLCSEHNKKKE